MAREARERRPPKGGVSLKVELPPVPEGAGGYTNRVIETPPTAAKESVEQEPHTRERELRWLEENRGKLGERYGGQWIVLEGQKLIAHGRDAAEVLSQARAKGIRVPFLLRIPSKDEGPLAMETHHV